ncbi:MAG: TRAP transporter small permease [Tissierellaceae bacterium]
MKVLNKISNGLNKLSGWFLILAFSVMTVTYFSQILLRYVFQTGLQWTEELTRYTNVALVMIGTAIMAGKDTHINVSILESLVPKGAKKWVIILQQLITGTFFAIAIKISFDMIKLAGSQVSTNMRIPMAYVYGMFPIAFSILVFQVIVFILNSIVDGEGD